MVLPHKQKKGHIPHSCFVCFYFYFSIFMSTFLSCSWNLWIMAKQQEPLKLLQSRMPGNIVFLKVFALVHHIHEIVRNQ